MNVYDPDEIQLQQATIKRRRLLLAQIESLQTTRQYADDEEFERLSCLISRKFGELSKLDEAGLDLYPPDEMERVAEAE